MPEPVTPLRSVQQAAADMPEPVTPLRSVQQAAAHVAALVTPLSSVTPISSVQRAATHIAELVTPLSSVQPAAAHTADMETNFRLSSLMNKRTGLAGGTTWVEIVQSKSKAVCCFSSVASPGASC